MPPENSRLRSTHSPESTLSPGERAGGAFFEKTNDAMLIADDARVYVDANPAACRLLGRPREEIVGRSIDDFAPSASPQDVAAAWAQFLALGDQQGQFQLLRADGTHVTCEFIAKANVLPGLHLSILWDAQRRGGRSILAEREEALRLALEAGELGAWQRDLSTDDLTASDRCAAHYGLAAGEELTYVRLFEIIHPDDRDGVRERIRDAVANCEVYRAEYRVVWPDGSIHVLRAYAQCLLNSAGKPVRLAGFTQDVTSQRELERQYTSLLASEQLARRAAELERLRLESLFRQAPALVNIQRGPEHIFELVHPLTSRLFGGRDLTGLPVRDAVPELEGQGFFEALDRVYATGEPFFGNEMPVRALMPDGSTVETYFDFIYQPWRDLSGEIAGVMTFAVDVTDRVRAQRERDTAHEERAALLAREQEARRAAEEASRLKEDFLATVSHELRTPLNAMLGWTRMIRSGTLDEAATARAMETIDRNVRAQAQIIEDLLDISRIISGKLKLDIRLVDTGDVIKAVGESIRPAAEAKGIRLRLLLDPSAGPVSGDPDRLQQVVWNLVSNAVKFTPKGGRIEVRLERVESQVEIVVSDSGQGIAPEFIGSVFDRFRQADGSASRRHGGLGLGLSIVRQLVELHGGTVGVESEGPGRGSTFTVSLPLAPVRSQEIARESRVHPKAGGAVGFECPPQLEGLRILVVDDEPDARDLLTAVLGGCGAEVLALSSADEGLAMIEAFEPDVLVSDIGMPGRDGYDLIRSVRGLAPERAGRVPAVALTAYARVEDRVKAFDAGFQMHVPKPVEPSELVAVVAGLATWRHREGP